MQNFKRASVLFLEWLTALLLLTMMLVTFADVVGRYLFSAPIFGAAEMVQFLLAATVFSALGVVSARNGHIAVELFGPALAAVAPRVQRFIVSGTSAAGLSLIGSRLWANGFEALHSGRVTIVLEWPIAVIALPSAVLCFLAAALQLIPGTNQ